MGRRAKGAEAPFRLAWGGGVCVCSRSPRGQCAVELPLSDSEPFCAGSPGSASPARSHPPPGDRLPAVLMLAFCYYGSSLATSIGSCLPIHCDSIILPFFPPTWVKTGSQLGDRAGSTGQFLLNREIINVHLSTGCHRVVLSPSIWDMWDAACYCSG